MFKRRLGRSDLEVSALGMGCWAIGGTWTIDGDAAGWGRVEDAESLRALAYALEAGVDFFDTAANYGAGHSERLLGQALAGRRDRVVLATKFGYTVDEAGRAVVTTPPDEIPGRIRGECEDSLRRLRTDYIDLYQLHEADYPPQKAPEVYEVLERLVEEGKIRWYGWSTDNPEGARAFTQGEHCTAIQQAMNMGWDKPEMLAVCEELDQASVIRTPLGMGMMTGKFRPDTTFPADDVRHGWKLDSERPMQHMQRVEAVRKLFEGDGRTQAQIALAWLWMRSARTIPIPGFRDLAQVQENIAAMEFGPLSEEQMGNIDEIFERPPVLEERG
jgi:aryl-alcohol dehydrogenase-like predicted oxidoreductase